MTLPVWIKKLLIRSRIASVLPSVRQLSQGGTAHLHYYSDRILSAPLQELLDPALLADNIGSDVIDLNQAAPRFEIALGAARLSADRRGPISRRGLFELRNAIADYYVHRDGRTVDPLQEVIVTNGATSAYLAMLDAFVNPGDSMALFDPCSPLFRLGAQCRRARTRWITSWIEDGRLRFPISAFERAVRGAKVLVLCDPMNPTGATLSQEDLDYIMWFAASYDVLIYSDESFARYRYSGRFRSIAAIPGAEQRCLITQSLSPGWGIAQAQIGWMTGHRHLLQACALVANMNARGASPFAQEIATRALSQPEDEFKFVHDRFRSRRIYTVDRLRAMGLEPVLPSGGYFIWVSVASTGMRGREFSERLYREHQVWVGPGELYGPSGSAWIRVSFAMDEGRLREGLNRMARFLKFTRNPHDIERNQIPEPVQHDDSCSVAANFSRE